MSKMQVVFAANCGVFAVPTAGDPTVYAPTDYRPLAPRGV
jgi:hypothetical protein